MEIEIKDFEGIMHDVKAAASRASEYRRDADTGINVNTFYADDPEPSHKKVESLIHYLVDAKDNLGLIHDSLQEIHDKLDDLLELMEYQKIVYDAVYRKANS